MNSISFLVASLEFPMYSIMSSVNSNSFIHSFPILTSFIILFWLLLLGLPKLCWIKVMKNEHFCLALNLRGNVFGFSPMRMMLAVIMSYMAFIMLKYVTSIPSLWRVLYHKWVLNFVKSFFCIYWDGYDFYTFVITVYHRFIFKYFKTLAFLGKCHLIKVFNTLNVLFDSVC